MFGKAVAIAKNNRALLGNISGMLLVKGAAALVVFFALPAYIRYFNDQAALGVWYTLLAVLNWMFFFDLGIGNGLRNKLAFSLEKGSAVESKRYISSAYALIGGCACLLCAGSFFFLPIVPWNVVFGISQQAVDQTTLYVSVQIVFVGVLLQFVLKLISSVLYAMQKSAMPNVMALISNVAILVYVVSNPEGGLDFKLISLSVVSAIANNAPLLVASVVVFGNRLRRARPSFRYVSASHAKSVLSLGAVFLLLQIASLVLGFTNEFLIAWLSGASDVVEYQVYFRVFSLFSTVALLVHTPLWSAVTQKMAQGNYAWVDKAHNAVLLLTLVMFAVMLLTIPLLQAIVDIWLGSDSIHMVLSYALAFAVSTGLVMWNNANCYIADGLGWLKPQLFLMTTGALLNIPLAWFLTDATGSWIGVVIANCISLVPICVAQPVYIKIRLKKSRMYHSGFKS